MWEIAIKTGLGKLTLAEPFESSIPREITKNGFQILPIEFSHLVPLTSLSYYHRDPFDRLLIAQAIVESFPVGSNEVMFDAYGVSRRW